MSLTEQSRGTVTGYEIVHGSREFQNLRGRYRRFVAPVTGAFLAWYFLFVILAAFAPGFMRIKVLGEINVGICFGVLQFVTTFAVTMAYARWARRNLDPMADRLRQRVESRIGR